MSSPIVKGMPYATMRYEEGLNSVDSSGENNMLPTVASEIPFGTKDSVLVDGGKFQLDCHSVSSGTATGVRVEHEVQIYIPANDFTWLVFFSEPVLVRCMPMVNNNDGSMLQVVGSAPALDGDDDDDAADNSDASTPFIIRLAILNTCTTGRNPIYCNQEEQHVHSPKHALSWGQGDYGDILRSHAHLYPGPNAAFSYEVNDEDDDMTTAILQFDWDMQDMGNSAIQSSPSTDTNATAANASEPVAYDLIMFSLMHHLDMMGPTPSLPGASNNIYCAKSLTGPACLIQGSTWNLVDELPQVSFRAPRPPAPWAIQDIADSLRVDIAYTLPDYFQRGAGDTYFSGKMLAKLGRILLIAEEIGDLCSGHFTEWERGLENDKDNQTARAQAYTEACAAVDLPSEDEFTGALDSLRSSVEVWINGTAETPFVYDAAWGGVASCGCNFDGSGCENKFPDCPAFENPGLNFGNAFYNDMHFHYGYHIFAAAAVAHFDHDWGKRNFENVLLLIRNIANPSKEDSFFPVMRHKDVFQGHSWASGISRPYLNGKNQESSSEAIAAYESVALYGKVMSEVFMDTRTETKEYEVAKAVRGVGKVMTAMELRAAKRYYHVRRQSGSKSGSINESEIFPTVYTPHVIGIMWQTMAQFQTWFGNAPYLAYGIQLLPLTPIAEDRDDVEWVKEMYPSLAASCEENAGCAKDGWSVVQLSSLATVGHAKEAFDNVLTSLSAKVFESAGGNGHSLTNTLWYMATRRPVEEPLPLIEKKIATPASTGSSPVNDSELTDCHCPGTCTDEALNTMANSHSCRERIQWVMDSFHKTQKDACVQVASLEFPNECGSCNPFQNESVDANKQGKVSVCPPCTDQQCKSDLNRCPAYKKSFVCTNGRNAGGCAGSPWTLQQDNDALCTACCELTNCPQVSPQEVQATHDATNGAEVDDQCPLCSRETCRGEDAPAKLKMPLCPVLEAPYLCQSGSSIGGCSPHPWYLHDQQCEKCCKLTPECGQ
jgi:endoglucanase Acf2